MHTLMVPCKPIRSIKLCGQVLTSAEYKEKVEEIEKAKQEKEKEKLEKKLQQSKKERKKSLNNLKRQLKKQTIRVC